MAKRNKREKDALDNIIDQLDLDGVTQEELFGEGGLVKALTSSVLSKLKILGGITPSSLV